MSSNITKPKYNFSAPDFDWEEWFQQFIPRVSHAKTTAIIITSFCAFLLLAGLFGNAVSCIIFSKKGLNSSTTSVYLRFLAVADTLCLLFNCVIWKIRLYMGFIHFSDEVLQQFICAFSYYGIFACLQQSSWLVVAMTVDRSVHIFFPTKSNIICTKKRACMLSTFIFIVPLIFYHPYFYLYKKGAYISIDPKNKYSVVVSCEIVSESASFYLTDILFPLDTIMYSVVPSVILLVINSLMIRHVYKSTKRRQEMTQGKDEKSNKKALQMTITLICISFYFFLSTFPVALNILIFHFRRTTKLKEYIDHLSYSRFFNLFSYTNNAVNFFIYCLSGSKFRKEFRKLFIKEKATSNSSRTFSTNLKSSLSIQEKSKF